MTVSLRNLVLLIAEIAVKAVRFPTVDKGTKNAPRQAMLIPKEIKKNRMDVEKIG